MVQRVGAAVLAAALLCLSVGTTVADHPQAKDGVTVTFVHEGDNEWWVEVLTKASAGDSVVAMEVRAESSTTWRGLQNKGIVDGWTKWGPETAFRIPAGDRVMFRAHVVDDAGAPGTVDSCLFTHPDGVERCAPPPPSWRVLPVGDAGIASHAGDMAVGDADNDGRRDVTIATRNGIHTFEHNAGAWHGQRVGTRTGMSALAVGDGDGDGRQEVYAVSNNVLVQYRFVDGAWVERVLMPFPEPFAGDMTLGDIDGTAGPELYVGVFATVCDPETHLCSSESAVRHVRFDGLAWRATKVADLSGRVDSMWIGDGDGNGRPELYVGHGTRHADRVTQVLFVGGGWQSASLPGTGSSSGFSLVVAGDGDRDGVPEVYTLNYEGRLRELEYDQVSGWGARDLFTGLRTPEVGNLAPHSLFLGDGDADGSQELYIGTDAGQVYQARAQVPGGAWAARRIADPADPERGVHGGSGLVVVGDGDGDGRSEVYAGISFQSPGTGDDGVTRVHQVKPAAQVLDATFTGVRGNEWWVQVFVDGNGASVAAVDVSVDGGDWRPLPRQTWGGHAASHHVVDGSIVQIRATSSTGAHAFSDCHRWIPPSGADAAKVPCPDAPEPGAFDATYSGVRGNEWWVEAVVTANTPVHGVFVHVGGCGGEPADMTYRADWGKWVLGNTRVPSGSKVVLEAYGDGGSERSGGYVWPDATPTGGC